MAGGANEIKTHTIIKFYSFYVHTKQTLPCCLYEEYLHFYYGHSALIYMLYLLKTPDVEVESNPSLSRSQLVKRYPSLLRLFFIGVTVAIGVF